MIILCTKKLGCDCPHLYKFMQATMECILVVIKLESHCCCLCYFIIFALQCLFTLHWLKLKFLERKDLIPCIRIWLRGIRRAGRNLTRNAIESVGKTLLRIKELSQNSDHKSLSRLEKPQRYSEAFFFQNQILEYDNYIFAKLLLLQTNPNLIFKVQFEIVAEKLIFSIRMP